MAWSKSFDCIVAQSLIYVHVPAKPFGSLHIRSDVLGDGVDGSVIGWVNGCVYGCVTGVGGGEGGCVGGGRGGCVGGEGGISSGTLGVG